MRSNNLPYAAKNREEHAAFTKRNMEARNKFSLEQISCRLCWINSNTEEPFTVPAACESVYHRLLHKFKKERWPAINQGAMCKLWSKNGARYLDDFMSRVISLLELGFPHGVFEPPEGALMRRDVAEEINFLFESAGKKKPLLIS